MDASRTFVDVRDVLKGLDAMRAAGRDLRPVFRQVRKDLKEDVQEHFFHNEGPDGRWAPYARSTLDRALHRRGFRRKRGVQRGHFTARGEKWARNQLGRLKWPSAWKIKMDAQTMVMAARTGWAGVHQFGGVVGKGSVIPARPFMWASDKMVTTFEHALVGHLLSGWMSGGGLPQAIVA